MRSPTSSLVPMRRTLLLTLALLSGCQAADPTPVDPSNATYTIDRRTVTLNNGVFEEPAAPGSAAKATTRLTDKRGSGDLNGDGKADAAVVLTFTGSGSGTFYYIVALLGQGGGKSAATNAIVLGDRIGVDAVRIDGGKILVDTLERKPGEPFTTTPSVRATRMFQLREGALTEAK